MANGTRCEVCGQVVASPQTYLATKDLKILQLAEQVARGELRAKKAELVESLRTEEMARLKKKEYPSPVEQARLREEWLRDRFFS